MSKRNGTERKTKEKISIEYTQIKERVLEAAEACVSNPERWDDLGLVTYEELMELTGIQDWEHIRRRICSMRGALLEHHIALANVPMTGYRVLRDSEMVATGDAVLLGVRRKVERGARVIASVRDFDALSEADKVRHNTALSVMGAVAAFSGQERTRQIEAKVKEYRAPLMIDEAIEAFLRR